MISSFAAKMPLNTSVPENPDIPSTWPGIPSNINDDQALDALNCVANVMFEGGTYT